MIFDYIYEVAAVLALTCFTSVPTEVFSVDEVMQKCNTILKHDKKFKKFDFSTCRYIWSTRKYLWNFICCFGSE